MRKAARYVVLFLALSTVAMPAHAQSGKFYQKSAEGWFWYDDPKTDPEPEVIPEPPPPPPTPPVAQEEAPETPPPGSTAWLRAALPAALDVATDDPSYANVERYFLLQKQAMDKAEKFSEVSSLVTVGHPTLDEGRRRPYQDKFAKLLEDDAFSQKNAVLKELYKTTGVILFLDKKCSGCAALANNLGRMATSNGLAWRVISLDGAVLPPEFDTPMIFDEGLAEKLGVTTGGAVFLATPPDRYEPISWNATGGAEIEDRILLVAFRSGLISEDQYRLTEAVNPMGYTPETQTLKDLPTILDEADALLRRKGIYIPIGEQQ